MNPQIRSAGPSALKVLTSHSSFSMLDAPAPAFEQAAGRQYAVEADSAKTMLARITGGESGDIVILMERLGIAEQMKPKTVTRPGGYIARVVATGEAEIAIQQIVELLAVPGVELAAKTRRDIPTPDCTTWRRTNAQAMRDTMARAPPRLLPPMTFQALTLPSAGLKQAGSVLRIVGLVLTIFSATMLVPMLVSLLAGEPSTGAFIEAALLTAVCGSALWGAFRHYPYELQSRDGFLLVSLTWGLLPVFGALPLLLFLPPLSFTDGFFEAASGLTTTGATVLTGLDRLPTSINLWRAQLQWMGGMGLIVLAVAILPLLGVGGRQLFSAETPGAFKESKLTPRIEDTARGLWYIYAGITAACAIAYWLGGMSAADAVIHSFATLSLGGYSSHDASFGHFDSPALEAIAMVFMLIAGINFSTHFLAWRGKAMRPYRVDAEAGWFLTVTLGSAVLIAVVLALAHTYASFGTALRFSLFNTISIATTTGYANTDYAVWPIFAPGLLLTLCLFASSAGSTGGGVKMIRVKLAVLQLRREFIRLCHPSAVVPIKIGKETVPPAIMVSVLTFLGAYATIMVVLTLVLTASGLSLVTAASAIIACISNTGPGLNEVGPSTTYAVLTDFQTWVCSIAMLIGRLELLTVLVIFTRGYWRR